MTGIAVRATGPGTAASLRRKASTCRRAAAELDRWKPALANEYLADAATYDRLADELERQVPPQWAMAGQGETGAARR